MINVEFIDGLEVFSCLPASPDPQLPPLLFVHGAFAGGWMWTDTFLPYFAQAGYRCYALSLRGHGGTPGREQIDSYSIADYVDDVRSVVEHLGVSPVLIGHSMGGFVVQKYLEKRSAPGAVLLCSVPPQGLIAAQFNLLFQKPHLFAEINSMMSGQQTGTETLREALFAGEADEVMLNTWLHQMQPESHRAIWDMSVFALPALHFMPRPPLLVLGAEKDVLVPAFLVQSTAFTYGQYATLFKGMGHAVTHEAEWRKVAGTIAGWLGELKP